jgi:hypothetical protein
LDALLQVWYFMGPGNLTFLWIILTAIGVAIFWFFLIKPAIVRQRAKERREENSHEQHESHRPTS